MQSILHDPITISQTINYFTRLKQRANAILSRAGVHCCAVPVQQKSRVAGYRPTPALPWAHPQQCLIMASAWSINGQQRHTYHPGDGFGQ